MDQQLEREPPTVRLDQDRRPDLRTTQLIYSTNSRRGTLVELRSLDRPVDFFLHDSLHTREHEAAEYEAVAGRLTEQAVVLSDNAHVTDALPAWAEATGRRFT
ncbi:MAG: class I SAM-dependent methyltransferase, partial [Actinomycetes bacterium]